MTVATMSAALYANTNLDSEENKGKRGQMIDEFSNSIEERFAETIAVVYGAKSQEDFDAIDMDDPFFAAMKLPQDVQDEMAARAIQKPTQDEE